MEFRRATPHDFSAIQALQSANLVNALAAEDRQGGFLSAEFTRRQIAKMASDIGIIVAVDRLRIVGYVCGSQCDFNQQFPLLPA